jgi:hypothetical protein
MHLCGGGWSVIRTVWKYLLIIACAACLAGPASAYTVNLVHGDLEVLLYEPGGSGIVDEDRTPTSLPYTDAVSITGETASLLSTYDFSNAGFSQTFDYARGASWSGETDLQIYFSVDDNVAYMAEGVLSATDSVGGPIRFEVLIYDRTIGSYLLESDRASIATPNEIFRLGETGGDYKNDFAGALAGTLIAGHEYALLYSFDVAKGLQYPEGEIPEYSDATFSGNISLSFSAIPEPSTGLLVTLGLLCVSSWRRGRRP